MNTQNKLPLIVIFGRTNVGKSTLFNCLIEKHQALVSDIEGTTRDSNIGTVDWQRKTFQLIDTGGIINLEYLLDKKTKPNLSNAKKIEEEDIEKKVQQQAREYIKQADLILFLVDVKTGLLPQDKQLSLLIKKIISDKKKIILIANKSDAQKHRLRAAEFHKLSLGDPISVSSVTGSGTGDLLDIIVKKIKYKKQKNKLQVAKCEARDKINICIVGKPNVGKSSLLNSILGYQRVIVSPISHTTREPQNTDIK